MNDQILTHAVDPAKLSQGASHMDFAEEEICLKVEDLELHYGEKKALNAVNLEIPKTRVTAFIGPSGCGKSTLLRCFNRMNDLVESANITGKILLDNDDIYSRDVDVPALRRRVGMVFQRPNPFPKSIYENVAYGLRLQGINKRHLWMSELSGH